jgi:WD40 repeat protein
LLAREAVATTYSVDKTVTAEAAEILRNSVPPEPITLRFGHTESVKALAFSPDGNRLASASDNLVKVWDTSSGNELLTLPNHSENFVALAWSNDGARLLCAEGDKAKACHAEKRCGWEEKS